MADSPLDDLLQPLAALHEQCNKRVWGLRKNELGYDMSKVMQHPPDELFATVSVDMLLQQYNRLRLRLQSLSKALFGHEFFKPISFSVRLKSVRSQPLAARPVRLAADKIDMSRWPHRYIPQLTARACMQGYGEVDLLEVQREPDMLKIYQYTMATNLVEVRCRDIWYIVIAWHFYVHTAVSSEFLAESVGSFLAAARRHSIN